jgi:signal transduction histidine kinase
MRKLPVISGNARSRGDGATLAVVLSRCVYLALVAALFVLLAVALIDIYRDVYARPCFFGASSCPGVRVVLARIGAPVEVFAMFHTLTVLIPAAACMAVSVWIYRNVPADAHGLRLAAMLALMWVSDLTNINVLGMLRGGFEFLWLIRLAASVSVVWMGYVLPNGRFLNRGFTLLGLLWLVSATAAESPVRFEHPLSYRAWGEGVETVVTIGIALSGLIALVLRGRSKDAVIRAQIRRILPSGIALIVAFLTGNLMWAFTFPELPERDNATALVMQASQNLIQAACLVWFAIAVGEALLRRNLFGVRAALGQNVAYVAFSAGIIVLYGVFVGGVSLALSPELRAPALMLAAGCVALAADPLRRWTQCRVDALFFGERDDPSRAITRLAAQLTDVSATETGDAPLQRIAQIIAGALRLPYVAVRLKSEPDNVLAQSGEPVGVVSTVRSDDEHALSELLVSARAADQPLTQADTTALRDFAQLAEAAVFSAQMAKDLRKSREALVNAREEERRRLRRDLHDGLGPTLAGIVAGLDMAGNLSTIEPARVTPVISELKGQTQAAIGEVRRLVNNLRPPALDQLGLAGAMREHVQTLRDLQGRDDAWLAFDLIVEPSASLLALPAAIEVALYRIFHEAVTNVLKHAQAHQCTVRLWRDKPDHIQLEVVDDGRGVPQRHRIGAGLIAMRERALELGGTFELQTTGAGTRILVRLPTVF